MLSQHESRREYDLEHLEEYKKNKEHVHEYNEGEVISGEFA